MGCGVSNEFVPPPKFIHGGGSTTSVHKATDVGFKDGEGTSSDADPIHRDRRGSLAPTATKLLGKSKYIQEYKALAMDHREEEPTSLGTLFVFCAPDTGGLVFSYRDASTGSVFAHSFTDADLAAAKEVAGVRHSWAPFFKSIASAVLKSRALVRTPQPTTRCVHFTIENPKRSSELYPFKVPLTLVSDGASPSPLAVHAFVMVPLTLMLQGNRGRAGADQRSDPTASLECRTTVANASLQMSRMTVSRLLPLLRPLREESALHSQKAMQLGQEVREMQYRIRTLEQKRVVKHPLDALYDEGGAQYVEHIPWSPEHHPLEEEPDQTLSACIRAVFPLGPRATLDSLSDALRRPDVRHLLEVAANRQMVEAAFEVFKGIDSWGYDAIQLEIVTNGHALFFTTYVLMYKLDLVRYFHIDDQTLRNFLAAVQAAYHPNPYHNAMHGADVAQINYYIMMVAGLCEKCQLSKEEILGGILSGPVHDFDHPGFNNNFHSRTHAYLATLYNDRSILENHHLACTFELMRNPRYDIFANLREEQWLTVRETMLEVVLATDMGNHAKIFKSFQARMTEASDWHSKKEDIRLALSMSIKMADISNCARPNHIYLKWAMKISDEFYLQGDAERELGLPISPFMDRQKGKEEFPKGQVSFITYIVQPMVEVMAELLPSLKFAIGLCNANREFWLNQAEDEAH